MDVQESSNQFKLQLTPSYISSGQRCLAERECVLKSILKSGVWSIDILYGVITNVFRSIR
jgi:hypothetical protein